MLIIYIVARFDAIGVVENAIISYTEYTDKTDKGATMKIHTTKAGESIKDIAKEYEVNEEAIRRINEIPSGEAAVGEELLIQIPTRSYTTQYGDTIDRISLRFGIRKNELYALNPWIIGNELSPGENLTLRICEKRMGSAAANGYFYKGCRTEKLMRAMPYLTYVSFATARADRGGIRKTLDTRREVAICNENNKIPLIKLYDDYPERYKNGENLKGFAEALIELATDGNYKGVVLDACPLSNSAKEFSAFLMILRKLMIGCDLILITEIDENSPIEFSEYADGSILYYPKYAMSEPLSFEDGEKRVISDFACKGESARAFIDLPSLALSERGYVSIDDANALARRRGYEIKTNENTLLSHLEGRKQGEYRYTSLSGTKALLELAREYDYMGICFDIMRSPLSHLMMYDSMFKTSYTTNVRSREGCSREVGE